MRRLPPGIVQDRVARSTGTRVIVARAEAYGMDPDDGPWVTVCVDHGGVVHHPTRALAVSWAAEPEGWCPVCMGEEPEENPAELPEEVVDTLREHVLAAGSMDEAIEDFRQSDFDVLYLPGGHKIAPGVLADELESWRPQRMPGNVTVYHATDRETADRMLLDGVIPELKPWTMASRRFARGEYAEFQPGAGVERGLYVGATPHDVEGFGRVVLALTVPSGWLEVPAELSSLGHKDPVRAMRTEHGALIRQPIHPDAIEEVA